MRDKFATLLAWGGLLASFTFILDVALNH